MSVGFIDVRVGDEPLLSGRFAQPVLSELEWLLDPDARDAGQVRSANACTRILCPLRATLECLDPTQSHATLRAVARPHRSS